MQDVIDRIAEAIPCGLSANRTRELGEQVIYDYYSTAYDGVKREILLKTYVYAATMARALEIQRMIDHAIVTLGDARLSEHALSCRQNGGGWLNEGDMHCRIAYYELIIREEL